MKGVPFFDRRRADAALETELTEAFARVLRSGTFILGAEVSAFEAKMADWLGVPHAIGVSSGTDALLAVLMALGVGPNDEVICPAYGFVATAEVVARLGATPVFADVLPESLLVDPARVAEKMGPRTRAILAVHLFGRCANIPALAAHAPVVEDTAQAFGATLGEVPAGALGLAGCFSFYPTKNLGGFGDGGLVTTRDGDLGERVKSLRSHGASAKHEYARVGGNFRLDALQAALLSVKLGRTKELLLRRGAIATEYGARIRATELAERVLPLEADAGSTFNQFVVRVVGASGTRDELRAFLADRGVGTEVYYPYTLPHQACFAHLAPAEEAFPVAEAAAAETLALPVFPELTSDEIGVVVDAIVSFFRERAR